MTPVTYIPRRILSSFDRKYLHKTTKFVDKVWIYFSQIEDDFRLLHVPLNASIR